MTCAGHLHSVPVRIHDRVQQRDHAALLPLEHEAVHPLEHQLGPEGLERIGTQGALQVGHPCRRLDAAADHIPDRDPDLSAPERDRVVPVAADPGLHAPGPIPGREPQPGHNRKPRQEAALQGLGDLSLDLHPLRRLFERLQGRAQDRVALGGFGCASAPLGARVG
jgi:hypothetical protein